ncbi:hypothetical protein KC865_02080 [Candidatus Kaiserbacteria bacterium]|nr:hypothetical protein [Candidatus Kaiserbacteria bacterium]USN92190.1 MAG: hypothetical protein H6782_04935 [Candidatus Nomurabacteria bacterium]
MQSKSLLLAIAAFAVTATGVHAYGGSKILSRAGLSEDQMAAIEEARELRSSGNFVGARDRLVEAGITDDTLRLIHRASEETRDAMHEALMNDDYEAFKEAVVDSPLSDLITSEADFHQFREAHELKIAGRWEDAEEKFTALGFEPGHKMGSRGHHHDGFMNELSDEQRDALMVARQANDRATIQAIFDEADIDFRQTRLHHRNR